jgi:peptide/nickel transport system permease protein
MSQAVDARTLAEVARGASALPGWLRVVGKFARHQPLGTISALVIVGMWAIAALSPLISPYPADEAFAGPRLASPSAAHWLGTDEVGRDVLSRLLVGSRLSLSISLVATVVGIAGGTVIGVLSGFKLGLFDLIWQRLIDAFIAMPILIVLMVIAFVTGGGLLWVTLAVALVTVPAGSRVIRSQTISVATSDYTEAAAALGATEFRIMFRHVLPNVMPTVLVMVALSLGQNILLQSALSFLGLVASQTPDWGSMLNVGARRYMEEQPWLAVAPGATIGVMVLAYNLLGDALRDVLDPRLRGSR